MFPFDLLRRVFRKPSRPAQFTLGRRGEPGIPGAREDVIEGEPRERPPFATEAAKEAGRTLWRSVRRREKRRARPEDREPPRRSPFGGMTRDEREALERKLDRSLDGKLKTIMGIFHVPRNSDVTIREFEVRWGGRGVRAAIVSMEGVADADVIRRHVLAPLLQAEPGQGTGRVSAEAVADRLVSGTFVGFGDNYAQVVTAIVEGETALLLEGQDRAILVGTRSVEHRSVEESPAEAVIRGPHFGFVENYRTNVALIRLSLQTPQLVTERVYAGSRSHTPFAIMYLEGVANPKLVEEVRRRITSIEVDYVPSVALLERYIEDEPYNPFPTMLATERPDRVAAMIAEGYVAIVSSCPTAAIVPATFWCLMQTAEDHHVHFIPASFMRIVRWGALLGTVYSSALYVAVVTYHPEMLPTELLFALSAAREAVPFPAVLEVLVMEGAFELIREAGIRIPNVIGPTIGIVGAVVLGQAAVAANLVSPILVIVVAISGLGSFAIPNYELGLTLRLMKLAMIAAGTVLGLPGITVLTVFFIARLFIMHSFGIPITAPLLPSWKHTPDVILRGPVWAAEARSQAARPIDRWRAPRRARPGKPGEPVGRGRRPRGGDGR
ncbi:MAG: spore germination protein [Firmicutes bacterium]|nr:spore germination protein [Bacillota bacterium]